MYWHTTGSFTTSRRLIILGPPLRFSKIFISLFIFFFLTGCKENKVHTNECYSSNQKSYMKTCTRTCMPKLVFSRLLLFIIKLRIWKMLLFEESWTVQPLWPLSNASFRYCVINVLKNSVTENLLPFEFKSAKKSTCSVTDHYSQSLRMELKNWFPCIWNYWVCIDLHPWEVLPEKLGGGVQPASQNPYPIYDQNLQFSLPYLWPDQKFNILFTTVAADTVAL